MKQTALQTALRQTQRDFSKPLTWFILAAVGLVLAFGGAFGTAEVLRPIPLGVYWIVVAIMTYTAGGFTSSLLRPALSNMPFIVRIPLLGLAVGLVISALILGINIALFGSFLETAGEVISFVLTVVSVSALISAILELVFAQLTQQPAQAQPPALLDRLPLEKRGALVALTVEDHYVRVRTTQGEEMVLMRLSDAIKETAPTAGLQVHRSHWVAKDAIQAARREAGKGVLTMTHGPEIPVSRANLPLLKDAGLLV